MAANEKMKLFNSFRAAGFNNLVAAEKAGYANPINNSSRLAKNEDVKAHFNEITKDIVNDKIDTAAQRQEFWTAVKNNDPSVCDPVLDKDGNTIPDFLNGGVKVYPIKMADRLRASELLGKAQQDFVERTQVDVNISVISQLMSDIEGTVLLPKILNSDKTEVIEGTVVKSE